MAKDISKYHHLSLAVKTMGSAIAIVLAELTSRHWWLNLSTPRSYSKPSFNHFLNKLEQYALSMDLTASKISKLHQVYMKINI